MMAHLFLWLVLLCSCVTVINGDSPPPRKKVAVEGVVYCLDCILQNSTTLVPKQYPIPGAGMKLVWNNTNKGEWEEKTTTDSSGSFAFTPRRVSSWGAHKCRLFLVSSPLYNCNSTGNPYPEPDGVPWVIAVPLTPVKVNVDSPFQFYTSAWPLFFYPHWSACT